MTAATDDKPLCALCKQPVEIEGFCLITADGKKKFCCAGCLSIYQLLNKPNTPPSSP
jgi:hypothetical protein